jgi:hypothetical protein
MPRIIVTTHPSVPREETAVLLDELVHSVHLSTGHAAAQLIERLAWAISDGEELERGREARANVSTGRPAARRTARDARPRSRSPVAA